MKYLIYDPNKQGFRWMANHFSTTGVCWYAVPPINLELWFNHNEARFYQSRPSNHDCTIMSYDEVGVFLQMEEL